MSWKVMADVMEGHAWRHGRSCLMSWKVMPDVMGESVFAHTW